MSTIIYSNENEDFKILVGKNNLDNWRIIDESNEDDLWIHINEHPSCHVIIKKNENKKDFPIDIIKKAGIICKNNSKCRIYKSVRIVYTTIKNVKKTDKCGEVYLKNFKISKFTI